MPCTVSILWKQVRKHACMRASLFEKAVRTIAKPRRRRIRFPAIGSKYLRSLLRASLDLPFFPTGFFGLPSTFSESLRCTLSDLRPKALLSPSYACDVDDIGLVMPALPESQRGLVRPGCK